MERLAWMTLVLVTVLSVWVQYGRCQLEENAAEKFQEEAGQIYSTVFHKYKPNVRPPDFYPRPVPIRVDATLIHIRGLDLLKQELESIIDLDIQWQDKRLAWYANKVVMITEELSKVWHPSVVYRNGALPPSPLFDSKVTISKDGMITWNRREIVTTVCATSPRNASQVCDIILGFTSPESMEVFDNQTSITLEPDFSNHLWDVDTVDMNVTSFEEVRFKLLLVNLGGAEGAFGSKNCSGELSYELRGSGARGIFGAGGFPVVAVIVVAVSMWSKLLGGGLV